MFHPVVLFLNIGTPELILILFVALLLFGGEKLPQMARTLGRGIRDFKDASEGVKREIQNQINNFDEKKEPEVTTPETGEEHKPLVANTTPLSGANYMGITEHGTETHEASHADVSHLIPEHADGIPPAEEHPVIAEINQQHKAEDEIKLTKE